MQALLFALSIDDHWERRAQRIHDAISEVEKLAGQLILCIFCSGRQQLMKLPKGKSVRPTYSMNEDVGFSDLFKHFQVADCALIGASRK